MHSSRTPWFTQVGSYIDCSKVQNVSLIFSDISLRVYCIWYWIYFILGMHDDKIFAYFCFRDSCWSIFVLAWKYHSKNMAGTRDGCRIVRYVGGNGSYLFELCTNMDSCEIHLVHLNEKLVKALWGMQVVLILEVRCTIVMRNNKSMDVWNVKMIFQVQSLGLDSIPHVW
jgi:hypothetical protein